MENGFRTMENEKSQMAECLLVMTGWTMCMYIKAIDRLYKSN